MRVEIHRKFAADAIPSNEGIKHFPRQAHRLAVISDYPNPIVLRGIKSLCLVLADEQTEDRERHSASLSAATANAKTYP